MRAEASLLPERGPAAQHGEGSDHQEGLIIVVIIVTFTITITIITTYYYYYY